MTTLEEKLRSEGRICPKCRYEIASPLIDRCPRCLTSIPVADPGCGKCAHHSACPALNAAQFEPPHQPR